MRLGVRLLGLAALLAAGAACAEEAPTNGRAIASIAKVAVTTRGGASVPFGARVRPGRPTLVSFWASWCAPCLAEAPWLARLHAAFGDRYNFLYVNRREGEPDPFQPPAAIDGFLRRAGLADVDYLVADLPAYRRIVGADFARIPDGKVGLPRIYLFDARGRQVYTAFGFSEAEGAGLAARLQAAMKP